MNSPEQQKRDRDWSILGNQVVGAETLPGDSVDEISLLKNRIVELESLLLASEAAGAEMRELFMEERRLLIRYGRENVEQRRMAEIEKALSSTCGTAFLAERERIRKALENLVKFTTELCEDVKVSTNYPSLVEACKVLRETK